jgi:hypothetical protein
MNDLTVKLDNKEDKDKFTNKLLELNCSDSLDTLEIILLTESSVMISWYSDDNTWSWSIKESDIKTYNLKVISLEEFLNYKKE